jgi:hypothetical protein
MACLRSHLGRSLCRDRSPPATAHQRSTAATPRRVVVGNPSAHKIGLLTYFGKLARALGTKNVFSASTLDQMPKQLASGLMFGHWLSVALPDISRTETTCWCWAPIRWPATAACGPCPTSVARPRRCRHAAADGRHRPPPHRDRCHGRRAPFHPPRRRRVPAGGHGAHPVCRNLVSSWARWADWVNGVDGRATGRGTLHTRGSGRTLRHGADTIRALAPPTGSAPRAAVYARIGTCTQPTARWPAGWSMCSTR